MKRLASAYMTGAFVLPLALAAQSWSWVTPVDGSDSESCTALLATADGGLLAGGAFSGALEVQGWEAAGRGGDDLYLLRFGAGRQLEWALAAGSPQDDEIRAVAELPSGDIALAGAFWFEIQLGDTLIGSGGSPRSLFAARLSPDGQIRWARSFPGMGLKNINALAARPDGSLALAGFFEQNLDLGAITLDSGRDDGATFAFVAVLDSAGETLWARQAGHSNDTRANALALLPGGALAIGGFFNDTTRFEENQFTANTFDRDVFLASYNADGALRWARKAGGVVDDELRALAAGPDGAIYATGSMIGVMALSEEIVIQTPTGNPDLFLLKYDADGTPLFGRALGGAPVQQGLAIDVYGGLVAVSGTFTGAISLDGLLAESGGTPAGYAAGFNTEGFARWLVSIPSSAASLASCLDISGDGRVLVGGSYVQNAAFDGETLSCSGSTGVFAGQLAPALTPAVEEPQREELEVQVFPNPGKGRFYLRPGGAPYTIELYDGMGRRLGRWEGADELHVEGLPGGIYMLVVYLGEARRVLRVQAGY